MNKNTFFIDGFDIDKSVEYIKMSNETLYTELLARFKEFEKNETDKEKIKFLKKISASRVLQEAFSKSGIPLAITNIMNNDILVLQKYYTNDKDVVIDGNWLVINDNCLRYCPNIENLTFSEGIQQINSYALYQSATLKSVHFPKSLKIISSNSFANCTNLENVEFESAKTRIHPDSFENTKWFDSFKDEFVVINNQLLKYQGNDTEIKIPEGVLSIANDIFENNQNITEVVFPKSLKEIWTNTFADCKNLEQVTFLGNELKVINISAFNGCDKLKEINIPDSLTDLGCMAFSKKTKVIYNGTRKRLIKQIKKYYPNHELEYDI